MANLEIPLENKNYKQIEDVIDAGKKRGQYDICSNADFTQSISYRRPWSAPISMIYDAGAQVSVDDGTSLWLNEGDTCNDTDSSTINIGPTDSEITLVRVKRESLKFKTNENKWNLHDEAVPGDGTHLGESPSLVNLVTLVGQSLQSYENKSDQYHEYLVPLSSWDPSDDPYLLPCVQTTASTNTVILNSSFQEDSAIKPKYHSLKSSAITIRHQTLSGKITSFLCGRCPKKSKTSIYNFSAKNGKSEEDVQQ